MKEELGKLEKKLIPDDKKTQAALGDIRKEIKKDRIRYVFEKDIVSKFHERMTIENKFEWIPAMLEQPQSFEEYKKSAFNIIYETRKTIYILPLDSTITEEFLESCKNYCEAFYYGMNVKILKTKDVTTLGINTRGEEQIQ